MFFRCTFRGSPLADYGPSIARGRYRRGCRRYCLCPYLPQSLLQTERGARILILSCGNAVRLRHSRTAGLYPYQRALSGLSRHHGRRVCPLPFGPSEATGKSAPLGLQYSTTWREIFGHSWTPAGTRINSSAWGSTAISKRFLRICERKAYAKRSSHSTAPSPTRPKTLCLPSSPTPHFTKHMETMALRRYARLSNISTSRRPSCR